MRTLHASLKSKANYAKSLCYRSPLWLHVGHNMEVTEISQQLSVSQSSVYRYIELFERTGDVRPKSYRHGPPKLLGDMEQLFLLRLILNYPGIYLSEQQAKQIRCYCKRINHIQNTQIHGLFTSSYSAERSDEQRAKFMAEVSMYDPSMLLWVDESGCDLSNCMRNHGYSLRGNDTPRPSIAHTRYPVYSYTRHVP